MTFLDTPARSKPNRVFCGPYFFNLSDSFVWPALNNQNLLPVIAKMSPSDASCAAPNRSAQDASPLRPPGPSTADGERLSVEASPLRTPGQDVADGERLSGVAGTTGTGEDSYDHGAYQGNHSEPNLLRILGATTGVEPTTPQRDKGSSPRGSDAGSNGSRSPSPGSKGAKQGVSTPAPRTPENPRSTPSSSLSAATSRSITPSPPVSPSASKDPFVNTPDIARFALIAKAKQEDSSTSPNLGNMAASNDNEPELPEFTCSGLPPIWMGNYSYRNGNDSPTRSGAQSPTHQAPRRAVAPANAKHWHIQKIAQENQERYEQGQRAARWMQANQAQLALEQQELWRAQGALRTKSTLNPMATEFKPTLNPLAAEFTPLPKSSAFGPSTSKPSPAASGHRLAEGGGEQTLMMQERSRPPPQAPLGPKKWLEQQDKERDGSGGNDQGKAMDFEEGRPMNYYGKRMGTPQILRGSKQKQEQWEKARIEEEEGYGAGGSLVKRDDFMPQQPTTNSGGRFGGALPETGLLGSPVSKSIQFSYIAASHASVNVNQDDNKQEMDLAFVNVDEYNKEVGSTSGPNIERHNKAMDPTSKPLQSAPTTMASASELFQDPSPLKLHPSCLPSSNPSPHPINDQHSHTARPDAACPNDSLYDANPVHPQDSSTPPSPQPAPEQSQWLQDPDSPIPQHYQSPNTSPSSQPASSQSQTQTLYYPLSTTPPQTSYKSTLFAERERFATLTKRLYHLHLTEFPFIPAEFWQWCDHRAEVIEAKIRGKKWAICCREQELAAREEFQLWGSRSVVGNRELSPPKVVVPGRDLGGGVWGQKGREWPTGAELVKAGRNGRSLPERGGDGCGAASVWSWSSGVVEAGEVEEGYDAEGEACVGSLFMEDMDWELEDF